ncbi:hypothetical protein GCM10023231_11540 [Olivibacter ginsenosidimutans]|uniref:Uncharacterized protein n=1 Tax=Olivibacter ginsenosidimutans TaxID=1176537 RepID=A0ABP9AU66_9SPHI
MISLVILAIVLFLALWAWLAYEFQHSGHISIEEEIELDEQLTVSSYTPMQEVGVIKQA